MAKIKYQGRKTFYDEKGNPFEVDIVHKQYDRLDKKKWRRVVIGDLLEVLDQIGNKKIKVLEFLLDNMNSKNEIDYTQREIAEATGISMQTINNTMKSLAEANVIKKIKRKYVLNNNIVSIYGSTEKNIMISLENGFHTSVIPKPKELED